MALATKYFYLQDYGDDDKIIQGHDDSVMGNNGDNFLGGQGHTLQASRCWFNCMEAIKLGIKLETETIV